MEFHLYIESFGTRATNLLSHFPTSTCVSLCSNTSKVHSYVIVAPGEKLLLQNAI